ncbi:MAG: dephospho-CoA kinase [Candidatus Dormibacteria bacterium]
MPEATRQSRVVALTGGIATGKSTVAAVLAELGATVIDADHLARQAVAPGSEGLQAVLDRFGPEMLTEDGALDRGRVAELVFHQPRERAALEAIVHPLVTELSRSAIQAATRAGAPLIVYEIPLLFEVGKAADFPTSILAYLRPELQLQRLMERSRLSRGPAEARIAAQMPIDDKRALATWVVDTSGTLDETREQVRNLWHRELRPGR